VAEQQQQKDFAAAELKRYESRAVARVEENAAAERRLERRRAGPLSAVEEIHAVVAESGESGPARGFWGLAADLHDLGSNVLPHKETLCEITGLVKMPHYNGTRCTLISLETPLIRPRRTSLENGRWKVRLEDANRTVISLKAVNLLPPASSPPTLEPLPLRELIRRAPPGDVDPKPPNPTP
jgi:hypothetical protein